MISLHSHSAQFCKHATGGSLEDVVREAIRKGFAVYGLSEHMPRTRRQDLYPEEEGMTPEDTLKTYDSFYAEAQRLKRLYKNEISLLVGMETENIHEETLGELERLRRQFKLDYLVGSVHHVNGVPIDFDKTMCAVAEATAFARDPSLSSGTEALFLQYFDAQYEMLQSCLPEVIGHFDLIRIFRADFQLTDAVWMKIRRNIDFGVSYGGIFELNSRAWKKQLESAYPQKDVLAYMISKNARFTLSDDSHGPADVAMHYDKLQEYIKEMGIVKVYWPGGGEALAADCFKNLKVNA